jgi:hypothetical protein
LGCVLLIAPIEHLVARHDLLLNTAFSVAARGAGLMARGEATECDILCLGDSLVKLGVVPRVLENALGRPAWNIAVPGGQPPGSFFLLRRALRKGAQPSAIVVDFEHGRLNIPARANRRQWVEMLTLAECAELAIVERDANDFAWLMLAKLCPSFRVRAELRAVVIATLTGAPRPGLEHVVPWIRNMRMNQGALVAADPWLHGPPPDEPLNLADVPAKWEIERVNAHYMSRFMELAAAHKIPVFWLLPPIRARVQAAREQRGLEALYIQRAYRLYERFPNLYLVDARHAAFPDTAFFNALHLDRTGALALTQGLARVIRSVLDGGQMGPSRVLELPRYREVGMDQGLEDLDTSRAMVGLARGAARK